MAIEISVGYLVAMGVYLALILMTGMISFFAQRGRNQHPEIAYWYSWFLSLIVGFFFIFLIPVIAGAFGG